MRIIENVIFGILVFLILAQGSAFASESEDFPYLKKALLVVPLKEGYSLDEKNKKTVLIPAEVQQVFKDYITQRPIYFNPGKKGNAMDGKDGHCFGPVFYLRGINDIDVYFLNDVYVQDRVQNSGDCVLVARNRTSGKVTQVPVCLGDVRNQSSIFCNWENLCRDGKQALVISRGFWNGGGYLNKTYYGISPDLLIKKILELSDWSAGPAHTTEKIIGRKSGAVTVEETQWDDESETDQPYVTTKEVKVTY